jgi:predicted metal-dependent HD superfamily phosphohydrolase
MDLPRWDDTGWVIGMHRGGWSDLVAVGIRTTADGPYADDVLWQFLLEDRVIELPAGAVGDIGPLARHLPGFDSLKVIAAMGSCHERIFRLWHRDQSRDRPGMHALGARFGGLVERLGARQASDEVFARLHGRWVDRERSYHDVEHLTDCLREVDRLPPSPARDRIELALWYHDAVYEPGAGDCEARSAAVLASDASSLAIPEPTARRVAELVAATAHGAARVGRTNETVVDDEAALVADIDLAILGQDPLRFMEFEYGVEEEYRAVPRIAFVRGRGRFLTNLLRRPIYRTPQFSERFERVARANVEALLRSPRYAAYRWLRWLPG